MDVGSPSLDGASDTQSCGDASPAHSSVVANSPSPPYIKPEPASCAMETLTKECSDVVLPEGMVPIGACTKKRRLHDESAVPRVVPSSMLFALESLVEHVPPHRALAASPTMENRRDVLTSARSGPWPTATGLDWTGLDWTRLCIC